VAYQLFIDSNQIQLLTFQMSHALACLHIRSIAHQDIKLSNLLVNYQQNLLKIFNFGIVKH
jgi:serine/threonine protein kinase